MKALLHTGFYLDCAVSWVYLTGLTCLVIKAVGLFLLSPNCDLFLYFICQFCLTLSGFYFALRMVYGWLCLNVQVG